MAEETSEAGERARSFLAGERLPFAEADRLWRRLKSQPALARPVLERIRASTIRRIVEEPLRPPARRCPSRAGPEA